MVEQQSIQRLCQQALTQKLADLERQNAALQNNLETLASEGIKHQQNYGLALARSRMLQERVWSLEKDLQIRQHAPSEDACHQNDFHWSDELKMVDSRNATMLKALEAKEVGKRTLLMAQLNETRSILEQERKTSQLQHLVAHRSSQEVLLMERAHAESAKFFFIWLDRCHRQKVIQASLRAAGRRSRWRLMVAMGVIFSYARRSRHLKRVQASFQRRNDRAIRLVAFLFWSGHLRRQRRVARYCVRPQRTRNDSVLLECFSHWVAILGLNAQVGSRADVIRRTAQNILPQWLHRHIDRALATLPDDKIPSELAVPKMGTSCVAAQNTEECRFCALTGCAFLLARSKTGRRLRLLIFKNWRWTVLVIRRISLHASRLVKCKADSASILSPRRLFFKAWWQWTQQIIADTALLGMRRYFTIIRTHWEAWYHWRSVLNEAKSISRRCRARHLTRTCMMWKMLVPDFRQQSALFFIVARTLRDCLRRCLLAWTYAVDRRKRNRRVVSHSLLRWQLVRKKQMIVEWGVCLRVLRQVQHKVVSFKELTNRKLTKMMVIHWKQMLDLKNLLSWVAHVLHGNLKRRTCAAWCKYLWYRMATRQEVLRATKTINRNKLKRTVLMWHVNVFMHRLRNRWLLSTSRSVLRGQLWRAALSWRYAIRMKAASRHKVEWFFVQRSRAILRRLLWAWAQYLRTCRDSISILVQSQGRSAAKAAQEAIERTTMLEWLYKQQFKAVYRVQMERAAVLVERKRLLRVVCSWKYAIERHHWHINLTSEWCQKRGMTWLESTFRSWCALTWVSASLLARKIGFLERTQKGKSKTTFKIWKRKLHKNKTGRHNMTRAATIVYERWVTRLLNHVLTKWFRCSEVARASQCVFLNLTKKLKHVSVSFAFSAWALHVQNLNDRREFETTVWIRLAALSPKRNKASCVKILRLWNGYVNTAQISIEKHVAQRSLMRAIGMVRKACHGWRDLLSLKRYNCLVASRIAHRCARQLLKSSLAHWLATVDDLDQEYYDLNDSSGWSGHVPDWYEDSVSAVIQQRFATGAKYFAAWGNLRERHELLQKNRDCMVRRSNLHRQRDATRLWRASARKSSMIRVGNLSACCSFLNRRAVLTDRGIRGPMCLATRLFFLRCVRLTFNLDAHLMTNHLSAWRLRCWQIRKCNVFLKGRSWNILHLAFWRLRAYVQKEAIHTQEILRLQVFVEQKTVRRLQRRTIEKWYFANPFLQEIRHVRALVTGRILSRKGRRDFMSKFLFAWEAYTNRQIRLRASEQSACAKNKIFLNRRVFREWKNVEWLKCFSVIVERWYSFCVGLMLQHLQFEAVQSLEAVITPFRSVAPFNEGSNVVSTTSMSSGSSSGAGKFKSQEPAARNHGNEMKRSPRKKWKTQTLAKAPPRSSTESRGKPREKQAPPMRASDALIAFRKAVAHDAKTIALTNGCINKRPAPSE